MVNRVGGAVGIVVTLLGGLLVAAAPPAVADPPPAVQAALPPGGSFVPVAPKRVLDTRTAGGPTRTTHAAPFSALPVSTGIAAVLLNVTVVDAAGPGYVTVGSAAGTSNGNFVARAASATLALVRATTDSVPITTSATANIVVDVQGYVTTPAAATEASFTPLARPVRIADSRSGQGLSTFVGASTRSLAVRSPAGLPTNATAAIANVTIARATTSTYVTAWSGEGVRPGVSNVNASKGDIVANRALVPLDSAGNAALFASGGTTDVVVDVVGYLSPDPSGSYYTPSAAGRVFDRTGSSTVAVEPTVDGFEGGATVLAPSVDDLVPTTAVWMTLVGDHPAGRGYLTARPSGAPTGTSDLNLVPGRAVANAGPFAVSDLGDVVVTSTPASRVVADLSGWFRRTPADVAPGLWFSVRYPDYTDTPARADTELADAPGLLPDYFADGVYAGQLVRTPTNAYAIATDSTVEQATYGTSEAGAVNIWRRPSRVGQLTGVTQLATAGDRLTAAVYALAPLGQVYGFQSNANGELGTTPSGFITYPLAPTRVPLPAGVIATAVYAAQGVGYAVGVDGTVYSWGRPDTGQLGRTPGAKPWMPAAVDALTAPTAIAGDGQVSFAIDADGATWSWGTPLGGTANATPAVYANACPTAASLHADYNGVWELCDDGTVVQLSRLGRLFATTQTLAVAGVTAIGAGAGYDNGIRVLLDDGRVATVPTTGAGRYEAGFAGVTAVNGSPGIQITLVTSGG